MLCYFWQKLYFHLYRNDFLLRSTVIAFTLRYINLILGTGGVLFYCASLRRDKRKRPASLKVDMGHTENQKSQSPSVFASSFPNTSVGPLHFFFITHSLPFNVSEFWLYAAFSNQPWMKSHAPWHGRRTDCSQSVSLISAVPVLPGMQLMRSVALICSGQDSHAPYVWCPGGISSSPVMPFLYSFFFFSTVYFVPYLVQHYSDMFEYTE